MENLLSATTSLAEILEAGNLPPSLPQVERSPCPSPLNIHHHPSPSLSIYNIWRHSNLPIPTCNRLCRSQLLTTHFAELSMDTVKKAAQEFQNEGQRKAQNSRMLFYCITASISQSVMDKLSLKTHLLLCVLL